MLPLNTETPQLSDRSTIPSIPSYYNTSQLANIVNKSSTNQTKEKIEAQLPAIKMRNLKY